MSTNDYIRNFKEISGEDVLLAGGKGASLGEMTQAGIPVPPGFVILSSVFEKCISDACITTEIDSLLHSVNHTKMYTIENASEKIQTLILSVPFPKDIAKQIELDFKKLKCRFVAVRSSATAEDSSTAAWAGQLETYLNTDAKNLLENIKKCWASLFTPQATFYRFENDLGTSKISVAVVVQKMIQSDVSGIAFSVHPVTQDYNQLIIEAGYGLGEAIVSGQVTPDSYVVEKKTRKIMSKNISTQTRGLYNSRGGNEWRNIPLEKSGSQTLGDHEICELSTLILGIEKHYDFPCDIEWAWEGGKFYITQSRPITTLDVEYSDKKKKYIKEFSRNFPLFLVVIYIEFNKRPSPEFNVIIDTGHPLLVHTGGPLVTIYFPPGEVKKIFSHFGQVASNTHYFNSALVKFLKVVEEIKPYFKKKKSVRNLEELKYLYELAMDFLYGESLVWVAPLVESLPEETKAQALAIREQTQDLTSLRDELFDYNLGKLFPELGELTHFILPKSVFEGKASDELLKEATEYKKGFIYFNGKIYAGQHDKILKKLSIKLEYDKPIKKSDSIEGQSASPGVVSGYVKIVLTNKDAYKISIGDILVSPMTRPDFVPAMKRAAAFVTDEGGITCHAAIVAREMKKPCVIGTRIATHALKDGDFVEVDADNGVVKILQK